MAKMARVVLDKFHDVEAVNREMTVVIITAATHASQSEVPTGMPNRGPFAGYKIDPFWSPFPLEASALRCRETEFAFPQSILVPERVSRLSCWCTPRRAAVNEIECERSSP
jgi:hypothetical protein